MDKLTDVKTIEIIFGTGVQNLPKDGETIGCYMQDTGKLLMDTFPTLPVNEKGQIVLSWGLAKTLINALVKAFKASTLRCSGRQTIIKKPTGFWSWLVLAAALAGLEIFD